MRCLAVLLIATAAANAVPGPYKIVDLGTLYGNAQAWGLNETGQVVGYYYNRYSQSRAFLYSGGTMQDIGSGVACRVNDNGQAIIRDDVSGGGFLWQSGTLTSLGSLGQGSTYPEGINNAGQVVGRSRNSTGYMRAFIWQNGTMTDLGTMGGQNSYATGINDLGQIAGYSDTMSATWLDELQAFRMQSGVMTNIGSLYPPHGWSFAMDISSNGHVAGHSDYSTASAYRHGFLWTPQAGMRDLGTFGGKSSYVYAVNSSDQVVGYSDDPQGVYKPFLWSNGVLYDLNALINQPGWRITDARDINDKGWIAATATDPQGRGRAVLLTPEPTTLLMLLAAAAFSIRRGR